MRRSPAYIETPQIRLPPAVNISHQNIRRVHSEHTQNFIYPSLKCKWQIHTKLLAPNDLISLSYRTQYCVWNDNVYYELKKNRLKYLSATWPVLEDFLGLLKVSLSRHNDHPIKYAQNSGTILWMQVNTWMHIISICIFFNKNLEFFIKIPLKFVVRGLINNKSALVQVVAWHQTEHCLKQWWSWHPSH